MRHRIAIALTLAVTLVPASAAFADQPLREALPLQRDVTTHRCGFPVLIHSEGQAFLTRWVDEAGDITRAIETYPGLKYVMTNRVTGTRIVMPINGPAFFDYAPDGSATVTGVGPAGWWPHPVTRESGIFLIRGRFTFELDASGRLSSFRLLSGRIENVCPLLA